MRAPLFFPHFGINEFSIAKKSGEKVLHPALKKPYAVGILSRRGRKREKSENYRKTGQTHVIASPSAG